jgi:hypothetical protein
MSGIEEYFDGRGRRRNPARSATSPAAATQLLQHHYPRRFPRLGTAFQIRSKDLQLAEDHPAQPYQASGLRPPPIKWSELGDLTSPDEVCPTSQAHRRMEDSMMVPSSIPTSSLMTSEQSSVKLAEDHPRGKIQTALVWRRCGAKMALVLSSLCSIWYLGTDWLPSLHSLTNMDNPPSTMTCFLRVSGDCRMLILFYPCFYT